MLHIHQRLTEAATPQAVLTLPFESRQKSRLHTRLDDHTEVALLLPHGTVLRHGDVLRADNGLLIAVHAAAEAVSTVTAADAGAFARACYHLGNRHVPLQIGDAWLRYLRDHVLDDLVRGLGLSVAHAAQPFEPEAGAYAHHRHAHSLLLRTPHGHGP